MGRLFKECYICGTPSCIELNSDEIRRYGEYQKNNALIQDVFPELPAVEREFLSSGMCLACQRMLFCGTNTKSDRIKRESELRKEIK